MIDFEKITFSDLTKKMNDLNLPETWSEKYRPVKQEITEFDNSMEWNWITQYYFGCLFFALLNGNLLNSNWKKYFDKNLDFSYANKKLKTKKQKIIGVIHEYKAILMWILIADNNVLGDTNLRKASDLVNEMFKLDSMDKIYENAMELESIYNSIEERFGTKKISNKKYDFAEGGWSFSNFKANYIATNLTENYKKKLEYLERVPKYSLFCLDNNHWILFLGCMKDKMVFCDSYLHNRLRIFPKKFVMEHAVSVLLNKGGY